MAVKYSAKDKEQFIQILGRYSIIEDKKTDAYHIEKKKNAWEQVAVEYNAVTVEKRTVIQLKRLWDKIKRARKSALAEERRELMATGGGPPKPPPSPRPEIDNLIPHLEFEIDVADDSDGINLQNIAEVSVVRVEPLPVPVPSSAPDVISKVAVIEDAIPGPSSAPEVSPVAGKLSASRKEIKKTSHSTKTSHLDEITKARLQLIKREAEQLEELHRVRLEEAQYRRETARLQMLEQEAKFKKFQEELNTKQTNII